MDTTMRAVRLNDVKGTSVFVYLNQVVDLITKNYCDLLLTRECKMCSAVQKCRHNFKYIYDQATAYVSQ
jgi:hypothetical protein